MKQQRPGKTVPFMLLLAGLLLAMSGMPTAQAEPPVRLSPGDLLKGLISGVGSTLSEPAPLKVQRVCSREIEACWESRGLNKTNAEEVQDTCWKVVKRCPKVCREEYFSRRKAGISASVADPLFRGRRGEESSCVPGMDKLMHSGGEVKVNDSTVKVSVTVGGQVAAADITAVPVDEQGREKKRTISSPVYSKRSPDSDQAAPILLYLPAGRYRLQVVSPDRFYHPNQRFLPYQAFPKQVELVNVKTGETLDKVYTFGMGRLVVEAHDEAKQPLAVTVEIARQDKPGYRQYIPLDTRLLVGKYRLVITEKESRHKKSFDIEIKDGVLTTRTITFNSGTM